MIEAVNICKSYPRGSINVDAVKDVSFTIAAGSKTALLGKSGSGKTTLLNLLAGLDRITSGTLTVDGVCLSSCTNKEMDVYRRQTVGIVFQQFRLIRHRTAAQNIELPMTLRGVSRSDRKQWIESCLERVGLSDRADHFPAELSGGEQQRIAIARALVNQPKILVADEPTGNLDSSNADRIMDLLEEIQSETSTTLILVTHDEQLAIRMNGNIIRMADGSLIENTMNSQSTMIH